MLDFREQDWKTVNNPNMVHTGHCLWCSNGYNANKALTIGHEEVALHAKCAQPLAIHVREHIDELVEEQADKLLGDAI